MGKNFEVSNELPGYPRFKSGYRHALISIRHKVLMGGVSYQEAWELFWDEIKEDGE